MNNFKNFYLRNKHLIALTIGVTLLIFGIFTTLAFSFLDMSDTENETVTTTSQLSASEPEPTTSSTISEDETSIGDEVIIETLEPETTLAETLPSEELPYLIMVNVALNCVTVYAKDETGQFTIPVRAMACSTAREGYITPTGTYNTSDMFRWAVMADGTRAQYVYRFKGSYLFHSVPYMETSKDSLEPGEYNKLGSPASMGCVRLTIADAKWIYENCPVNTKVILYEDESSPGPLGKPDTIKIPDDSPYAGWDPTDHDPANPWHNFNPEIKAKSTSAITIEVGSPIEKLLNHFTITDTCGNEIPEKATIEGNYNLNIPGSYSVTIKVTDAIGKQASLATTFTVIAVQEDTSETTTNEETTENTTTSTSETESSSSEDTSSTDETPSTSEEESSTTNTGETSNQT